ncbi:MAG: hypothetical protein LBV79_11805 [Candidatus Adiutrix sp.]|jgi:hypothetical protein|nr:hypothetical protein [Candidatus Adiutrix sp.]
MRKLFIALILAACLASAPARAEVRIFDNLYSIDIPGSWRMTEKDNLLTLTSPDRQAVFLITKGLSVGQHRTKIAPELTRYAPLVPADPSRLVTLTRIPGLRVVVTVLGDHPDRVDLYYSITELERNKKVWGLE